MLIIIVFEIPETTEPTHADTSNAYVGIPPHAPGGEGGDRKQ